MRVERRKVDYLEYEKNVEIEYKKNDKLWFSLIHFG